LIGWSDSGDLGARREKILRAGVRVGLAITGRLIPQTTGTAPVPSHIAYFGGAVALQAERRSLIARYAWPGFGAAWAKSARLSTR